MNCDAPTDHDGENEFFKPFCMNNFLQGEYVILDDSVIGTSCNSPYTYVAAFGTLLADLTNSVIVVEKTKLRMPAIYGNGSGVFYYIYSIQYPPSLPNSIQVFVFFVIIYPIPICFSVLLDSLFKVCLFTLVDMFLFTLIDLFC